MLVEGSGWWFRHVSLCHFHGWQGWSSRLWSGPVSAAVGIERLIQEMKSLSLSLLLCHTNSQMTSATYFCWLGGSFCWVLFSWFYSEASAGSLHAWLRWSGLNGPGQQQETETPSGSPTWLAETWSLGPSAAVFSGAWPGSQMGCREARIPMNQCLYEMPPTPGKSSSSLEFIIKQTQELGLEFSKIESHF